MRDYVKGLYGVFTEVNTVIPLTLTLQIWRRDREGWDQCIQELEKDVEDAGPDWSGSVTVGPVKRWWLFGGSKFSHGAGTTIQDLLETYFHGTSQDSGAFDDLIVNHFAEESPRSVGYNSKSEKKGHRRWVDVPEGLA